MGFFSGANKYNVETQVDFFRKTIDGKPLEYDRVDDLSGQMMPGDIHKVTKQDIQAVRDFITNERKNYPDTSLEPLFREWEKLQGQYEEKLSKGKATVTAEAAKKVEEEKKKQEQEASAKKLNDANKKEKEEKEALARKLEEEKEQKDKKPPETTQNKKTSVPQSGENTEKKPDKPQKIDTVQSPEKNNTHEVRTSMIFKDGAYYLVGPKGRPTRVDFQNFAQTVNVQKDAPEKLQKSVAIVQDLALVLDAYLLANPKEKIKYGTAVESAKKLFSDDGVQLGNKVIDTKSVTEITGKLFSNFRVSFGDTDLRSINEALRKEDPKVRHLAVLQFIRERLGQYDLVAKTLIQENQGAFGFPADADLVQEGVDLSSTGLGKAGLEKVREAIGKARAEATASWNKNKKEYFDAYKQQHPDTKGINEEQARLENEKLTVLYFAKQEIAYQTLYNKPQQSPELKMLQDVLGAGSLKMSDRATDMTGEVAKMLALEAIALAAGIVTAGVGTVAINAAILGRNAYRGAKAVEAYNAASKTRQLSTTAGRILGSGAGFELGHANMISIMEGEGLTLGTKEGYAQSIAMMGVIKGVGTLIEKGVFGKGIQFKEGAGFWKNTLPFTGQVIIEGAAIFGTAGVVGQILVDGRDNWTPEQLAQAMIMATFFKGASRVMISKAPNGEVRAEPVPNPKGPTPSEVGQQGNLKSETSPTGGENPTTAPITPHETGTIPPSAIESIGNKTKATAESSQVKTGEGKKDTIEKDSIKKGESLSSGLKESSKDIRTDLQNIRMLPENTIAKWKYIGVDGNEGFIKMKHLKNSEVEILEIFGPKPKNGAWGNFESSITKGGYELPTGLSNPKIGGIYKVSENVSESGFILRSYEPAFGTTEYRVRVMEDQVKTTEGKKNGIEKGEKTEGKEKAGEQKIETEVKKGVKNETPLPKNGAEAKAQSSKVMDALSELTIPLWDFLPAKMQAKLLAQSPKKVAWFKHAIAGNVFGEMRKGIDIVKRGDIVTGSFDFARTALWSQKSGSWKPGVFSYGVTGLTALEMYSNPDPDKTVLGDALTKQFNNMYQWAYFGWLTNVLIEIPDTLEVFSDTGYGTKPVDYIKNRVTGETPKAPDIIAPFFK